MVTESQAGEMANIACFEVMPGWDTLNGYVIVRGRVPYGYRTIGSAMAEENAKQHLAFAKDEAENWAIVEVAAEEQTAQDDSWRAVRPISDKLGLGAPLAALVEAKYPAGEWRLGHTNNNRYGGDGRGEMIVRVVDGEVVAMVAPIVRKP